MLVNWDPNGSGGGGSGENPIIPPGTIPSGDIGTDILNLFNNGQISEEVMNQLLTMHSIMGLNNAQVTWLLSAPNLLHLSHIQSFLIEYGHEEGATEHAKDHLNRMMEDQDYQDMVVASFDWPTIVWTIAQELIGDALIDLLLNQIPFFNKQDEVRDIIKSAKNSDWLYFSYEVTKLVFKEVLKNNPYSKTVLAMWEGSEKAAKIGKALDKVDALLETMSTQAVERAWGILENMGGKLFEIDDLPRYLKYIDDLRTPKLGGYFATENTYNENFKNKFKDIKDEIWQVHHALPKKVKNTYGLIDDVQLHSLENLRGIPINDQFHQEITNKWNVWYAAHPNFTLQDALNYAKEIDDLYGHRFIPPIR